MSEIVQRAKELADKVRSWILRYQVNKRRRELMQAWANYNTTADELADRL